MMYIVKTHIYVCIQSPSINLVLSQIASCRTTSAKQLATREMQHPVLTYTKTGTHTKLVSSYLTILRVSSKEQVLLVDAAGRAT